eukprot:11084436-Prorocentrum_lima.AAC.1
MPPDGGGMGVLAQDHVAPRPYHVLRLGRRWPTLCTSAASGRSGLGSQPSADCQRLPRVSQQ